VAIGSGISSQLGMSEETTYGTGVTVTRFMEFLKESMKLNIDRIESKGLRAGTRTQRADRWKPNRKGCEGSIDLEVASVGFGLWFKAAFGAVATAAAGTTGKKHTFTLGANAPSYTVQVGRPSTDGTVQPFTYLGTRVKGAELSCDVDGFLSLTLDCDAQDETTGTALATASYPTAQEVFAFTQGIVTFGGAPIDVTKFSVKIDQGLNVDRYYIRGNPLKKQPMAGYATVTGEIDMTFDSLADYTRFTAGTTGALVATFTGATYEAGQNFKVVITCPAVRFDGDTPNVDGPDILTLSLPFTAMDDGTTGAPISLDYYTTDTLP
jgi:hypothetical protein